MIAWNQLGFMPDQPKWIYTDEAYPYVVIRQTDGQVEERVYLKPTSYDGSVYAHITRGNFSGVKQPGNYQVLSLEGQVLGSFEIGNQVYGDAFYKLQRFFYLQRCGTALPESLAGAYHHGCCHSTPAIPMEDCTDVAPDFDLDLSGGWHDAGDYGRYIVAAGKAVTDLLLAFERFGSAFSTSLNIPESLVDGGQEVKTSDAAAESRKGQDALMPDILKEVAYELRWMMKMQASDGSVYHKVTTRHFPDMVMPEDDQAELRLFRQSSPAAAVFAATMALAAQIYKPFDEGFAVECLDRAIVSADWLIAHPEPVLFTNPDNVLSGEYGDESDKDDRYWCFAQLYRTTLKTEYLDQAKALSKQIGQLTAMSWNELAGYGTLALIQSLYREEDSRMKMWLKDTWLAEAGKLLFLHQTTTFGITLTVNDYIWGSNMLVMNHGIILSYAHDWTGDSKYKELLVHLWHYIFGMNPLGISYVTGCGHHAVMHPHHRPSVADGVTEPMPGMLSGGPCKGLLDPAAVAALQGMPPAMCFVDDDGSYSTNEMTVYWNSPAVFVGAAVTFEPTPW